MWVFVKIITPYGAVAGIILFMTNHATPILVVEDDAPLRDAYTMILSGAGYDVMSATNGQEGLDALTQAQKQPLVILLDLRMPKLDGIGFLKQFDKDKYPHTTVVVFSNFDAKDEIEQAYKLGADRYVLKARATPKELLKLVNSLSLATA